MAQITYLEAVELINNYYGNPDVLSNLLYHQYTPQQIAQLTNQVPGLTTTLSTSGNVLGYDYDMSLAQPVSSIPTIDSNTIPPTYGVDSSHSLVPANTAIDGDFVDITSGAKHTATGITMATVADKLALGIVGVSLGTKLGVLIDSTLYAVDPEWWDANYPAINPQTWDDLTFSSEAGKNLVRTIFGLQNDSSTMYADERLLAYTYALLLSGGLYNPSIDVEDIELEPQTVITNDNILIAESMQEAFEMLGVPYIPRDSDLNTINDYENAGCYYLPLGGVLTGIGVVIAIRPDSDVLSFSGVASTHNSDDSYSLQTDINDVKQYDGRIWYYSSSDMRTVWGGGAYTRVSNIANTSSIPILINRSVLVGTVTEVSSVEGMSKDERASTYVVPAEVINPTTGVAVTPTDNIDDILQALKNKYPDLFSDSIYEDVVQQDGTVNRITYIPVPTPNFVNETAPVTGNSYQGNEAVNPQTEPESILDTIRDILVTNGDPPETGSGNTPTVVVPVGTASSMWKIYNPTEAELNSFASWLWTDNLIEQFKKLFNSPMDAVIGVHKVFASPSIGGRTNIKCGYLDSGVPSNYIDSQYTTIDCGTVSLREYFGNVFDYSPYTEISLFLPFIGIVKLDNADVMRADISVKYSVDVLTGACLAEVKVMRDNAGGNLYVFSGSAIVQYPLTSGSYAGAIAGVLSIAGGLAGTILSGGSMLPATVGVINGASRLRADVQKSGGFSGCAGAMGGKKPYLIISRPQTAMAENFQHFTGLPANSFVTLSACSGRTRVKSIHVENINKATNEEKDMIEQLLKTGVTI